MSTPENQQENTKYRNDFLILALLVGLVMLAAHVYDLAPQTIPTHYEWNLSTPTAYGLKSTLMVLAVIGVCLGLLGILAAHGKMSLIHVDRLSYSKMNEAQKALTRKFMYRLTFHFIFLMACVIMLLVPVVLPKMVVLIAFILLLCSLVYGSVSISFKIRKLG